MLPCRRLSLMTVMQYLKSRKELGAKFHKILEQALDLWQKIKDIRSIISESEDVQEELAIVGVMEAVLETANYAVSLKGKNPTGTHQLCL